MLSSAVFTMIGLYALITGKSNHWIVAVSIAVGVILFLFASFGAWKEQYDARIAAERLNDESKKTKEIRLKLAALMRQEPDVLQHLISASNDADEFSRIVSERDQWIRETVVVLNEAGLHTDAEAFSQIRNRPPVAEEVNDFRHVEDWKRGEVVRLAMYRKKLNQIIDVRRL